MGHGRGDMSAVRLVHALDDGWLTVAPVHVGAQPPGGGGVIRYALVRVDEQRIRVDVHAREPDCYAFEQVLLWHRVLSIGLGSYLHLVSADDRSCVSLHLDGYFGRLYPSRDYLLVTSAERVLRVEPDRSVRWTSAPVGIDGVLIWDVDPPVIRGEGEWDPPGDWRPFALDAEHGTLVGS
jgi:hypothetical protein